MGMTNAERQAKHRQRVKAQFASLRNTADGDAVALRNRVGELEATLAAAHARIAELERMIPKKRITFVPDDDSSTAIFPQHPPTDQAFGATPECGDGAETASSLPVCYTLTP